MITLRKATATLPDGTPISTSPYSGATKRASPLNGTCYANCLGAGKGPQYCEQFCSSGVGATATSEGIPGGVPDTSSGTPGTVVTTQDGNIVSVSGSGNVQSTPEGTPNLRLDDILIAIILILMAFKIYEAM